MLSLLVSSYNETSIKGSYVVYEDIFLKFLALKREDFKDKLYTDLTTNKRTVVDADIEAKIEATATAASV